MASKQEVADVRLAAVLKATGNAAGYTAEQLKQMAGDLQGLTGKGDIEIMDSMSVLATFKNIQGPEYQGAMKAMLDMSAVMGTDLKGASIQLGKAMNDPVKGVSALSEVGVSFTEQQKQQIEKMMEMNDVAGAQKIILNELNSEFGGAAEALGGTFSGKLEGSKNALKDLGEDIGEKFLPSATKNLGKFTTFIETHKSKILDVTDDIAFGFENIGDLTGLGLSTATLGVVGFANDVKHIFTTVIPAYTKWFGDNWKDVFKTIWSFTSNFAINMGKNFIEFGKAIVGWMKGDGWKFDWTPLTDGFENSMKDLPVIAERETTDTEKALTAHIAKMLEGLKGKYDEFKKNRNNGGGDRGKKTPKTAASFVDLGAMWNKMAETSLASSQLMEAKKQTDLLNKVNSNLNKIANSKNALDTLGAIGAILG